MTSRKDGSRKKPVQREVFVPVWAQRIRVMQRESDLLVVGSGLHFVNSSRWNMPEGFGDLIQPFESVRITNRSGSRIPPHLRFARASTGSEQISFVRDFGPVLAHKAQGRGNGDWVVACQSIAILEAEQKLFSLFVRLVQAANVLQDWSTRAFAARRAITKGLPGGDHVGNSGDRQLRAEALKNGARWLNLRVHGKEPLGWLEREAIESLPSLLGAVEATIKEYPSFQVMTPDPAVCWRRVWGLAPSRSVVGQYDRLTVLSDTNDLICRAFNQFQYHLYYGEGSAIEAPEITPYGIRPALYFMLRSDYLTQRAFQPCALPDCLKYFVPGRSNDKYCSQPCKNRAGARAAYKREKESMAKDESMSL